MIQYSVIVLKECSFCCHFLRNSACAKKSITRWFNDAIKIVRWGNTDGAIEHHRLRVIAIALSYYRLIVITPSTQTRWCDGTIVNGVALSGFHISDINLKCIVSSLVTSFVGICLKIIWYELLNAAIGKSNQSTVSTAKWLAYDCLNNWYST